MDTSVRIDTIRQLIVNKNDSTNLAYRKLDSADPHNDLMLLNRFPLYYMFDQQLNQNIGSSWEDLHNILRERDLYELFNIDEKNVIDLPVKEHASILYKIDLPDANKWYIFYSNSGQGIDNHPTYESSITLNKMVCPKILLFRSQELRDYICAILCKVVATTYELKNDYFTKKYKQGVLNVVDDYIGRIADQKDAKIFTYISDVLVKIIETNCPTNDVQNLFYALMYYLISSYPNEIYDVSFNDLINRGEDEGGGKERDDEYERLISKMSKNVNAEGIGFTKFYDNTNIFNKTISNEVMLSTNDTMDNNVFRQLVDLVNKKITECGRYDRTISFRKKIFGLKYGSFFGIANNSQSSGSCVFYSIYNLMISMKLLAEYNKITVEYTIDDATNSFVNAYLQFHYHMLKLLKMTIDKKAVSDVLRLNGFEQCSDFSENSITIILRTINMLKEYELLDEMNKMYIPSESKQGDENYFKMNDLLDIPIYSEFRISNEPKLLDSTYYIEELNEYLYNLLFRIRNRRHPIDRSKIMTNLQQIINRMRPTMVLFNPTGPHNHVTYYGTIIEIYYIYIMILIKTYEDNQPYEDYEKPKEYVNYDFGYLLEYDWYRTDRDLLNAPKNFDIVVDADPFRRYLLVLLFHPNEIKNIAKYIYTNIRNNIKYLCDSLGIDGLQYSGCILPKRLNIPDIPLFIGGDQILSYEPISYLFFEFSDGSVNYDSYFLIYYNYKKNIEYAPDEKISSKYYIALRCLAISMQKQLQNKENHKNIDIYISIITSVISCGQICIFHEYECGYNSHLYQMSFLLKGVTKLYHLKTTNDAHIKTQLIKLVSDSNYIGSTYCTDLFELSRNKNDSLLKFKFAYNSVTNTYTKNSHTYMSMINYENDSWGSLEYLLFRFGISLRDNDEFVMLITSNLISSNYPYYKIIRPTDSDEAPERKHEGLISFVFFKNNMHFSIAIRNNKFAGLRVNDHPIDFSIMPFMKTMPSNAPILPYHVDNSYYCFCILTSAFQRNLDGKMYEQILKRTDDPPKSTEFDIINIKISPSLLFCSISSFDPTWYARMNDNYETLYPDKIVDLNDRITLSNPTLYPEIVEIKKYIDDLVCVDNDLITEYGKNIVDIFGDNTNPTVLKSFLGEYRLCGLSGATPAPTIDFTRLNDRLNELRNNELKNIQNKHSFNEYIHTNIIHFIKIMEINIISGILKNLQSKKNCWELQRYLSIIDNLNYLNRVLVSGKLYLYEILFMLQNDYVYSIKQLQKYFEIRNDLIDEVDILKVHQFMMGRGKTTVFTPLLACGIQIHQYKQPTIITSSHLVVDTNKYLTLMQIHTDIKVNVFSDATAKERWIENTDITRIKKKCENMDMVNIGGESNIIDEFDSHHPPTNSAFNNVQTIDHMSETLLLCIYTYYVDKQNRVDFIEGVQADMLYMEIDRTLEEIKTMIYKKNYGFDSTNDNRLCIPYSRKDTPIVGSNFSSILMTLILTFKIYTEEYNYLLTYEDMKYIVENKQMLDRMYEIKDSYNPTNPYFNDLKDSEDMHNFMELLDHIDTSTEDLWGRVNTACTIYKHMTIGNKMKYLIVYHFIKSINYNQINITTAQLNMSFQDIIYNSYKQWQVGYTGTAYLKCNTYDPRDRHVFKEIVRDDDETIEIQLALIQYGSPKKSKMLEACEKVGKSTDIKELDESNHSSEPHESIGYIPIVQSINLDAYNEYYSLILHHIIDVLQENRQTPRGIVDLAGIFVGMNNKDIAQDLSNLLDGYDIVYLDENQKVIYSYTGKRLFDEDGPLDRSFYYYDQGHTVGTDIRQPQTGHFGIIVDKNTRIAEFAQAIFRFRQLNRGTYMTVFMITEDGDTVPTLTEFYNQLKNNETKFNENQEYGLSYQLMKAMVRKESKDYRESDLKPEFITGKLYENDLIKRLYNNTIGLERTTNKKILSLVDYLTDDHNKMRSIILGRGDDAQVAKQTETKVENKTEIEVEKEKNKEIYTLISHDKLNLHETFLEAFSTNTIYTISHYDCEGCINNVATKMFNDQFSNIYTINELPVYMSYNFLSSPYGKLYQQKYKISKNFESFDKYQTYHPDRWYFVLFEEYVLIEIEWIALTYYGGTTEPIYNHNGVLIDPAYSQQFAETLDIDPEIKIMLGMPGSNRLKRSGDLNDVIAQLTPNASILLKFNQLVRTRDRYNLSKELVRALDEITIDKIFENFKDAYLSCQNSSDERKKCSDDIETTIDLLLAERINSYPAIHHNGNIEILNANAKLRNQLFHYKRNPSQPIIEYQLSMLKEKIVEYIKKNISPIEPAISTSGPISLPGGSRSTNRAKKSYNERYIANKNNYVLLMRHHNVPS